MRERGYEFVLSTDIWYSRIMSAKVQVWQQQVQLMTMLLGKVLTQISIASHKQGKFIFLPLFHSDWLLVF